MVRPRFISRIQVSFDCGVEDEGQKFAEGHDPEAVFGREGDGRIWIDELGEDLAACAAGRAGGVVEVGDGDGAYADGGAVLGDGAGDGGGFSADGEAVADVFDVGAGNDDAVGELNGSADAEAGKGRVGVLCGFARGGDERLESRIDWHAGAHEPMRLTQ